MSKDKSASAFPCVAFSPAGDEIWQDGMTLRQWYAGRAPEIPDWFKPDFPDKPKYPDKWNLSGKHLEQWYGLMDGLEKSKVDKEVIEFDKKWNAVIKAHETWEKDYMRAHYFQWRYYYADAMLKEGGK